MDIGEKIKSLRKAKNLSQERFAEHFGVTPQAVSKWENSTAYPDVTLIPSLAAFLGISIDELFDFDRMLTEQAVMQAVDEAAEYRHSNPEKGAEVLKAALRKYPGNEILLNNLLYVESDSEEKIRAAKLLADTSADDEIKYDALRILAEEYAGMGNREMCAYYISKIPELYFTKSELEAKLACDTAAARKQLIVSVAQAIDMTRVLGGGYDEVRVNLEQIFARIRACE